MVKSKKLAQLDKPIVSVILLAEKGFLSMANVEGNGSHGREPETRRAKRLIRPIVNFFTTTVETGPHETTSPGEVNSKESALPTVHDTTDAQTPTSQGNTATVYPFPTPEDTIFESSSSADGAADPGTPKEPRFRVTSDLIAAGVAGGTVIAGATEIGVATGSPGAAVAAGVLAAGTGVGIEMVRETGEGAVPAWLTTTMISALGVGAVQGNGLLRDIGVGALTTAVTTTALAVSEKLGKRRERREIKQELKENRSDVPPTQPRK